MLSIICTICGFAVVLEAYPTHVKANNYAASTYGYTAAIFQPALSGYSTPFICSGALIAPNQVLTIAECINGLTPSDITIRTGASDATYRDVSVAKITVHPDFDSTTLVNDIAMIHLAKNVSGFPAKRTNAIDTSHDVTLVSWGSPSNVTQTMSLAPKIEIAATMDTSACATALAPCYKDLNPSQHLCTKVSGEGQAYGDGGGPVIDSATGMLIGLISGNPICAGPSNIALHVRLAGFRDWVSNPSGAR